MFGFVRIVIGALLFVSAAFLIRKNRSEKKRVLYICTAVITVILITVLAFIPLENVFISFDSPEEAYSYTSWAKADVKQVVYGDESALVVGDKFDSEEYLIIPKGRQGWQVGLGINTKRLVTRAIENVTVHVYQYKNTADYYVIVQNIGSKTVQIQDCYGTTFQVSEECVNASEMKFCTYYAHISNFDEQYWIRINDETVPLGDASLASTQDDFSLTAMSVNETSNATCRK